MSRNRPKKSRKPRPKLAKRVMDRRVRRTHERLGSALIALIQEKAMDRITMQEVLDRAEVGRSTFYVYFRDKNDLFLTQVEQGLESWSTDLSRRREKSQRLVPVAEMFGHIGAQKKLYRALVESGGIEAFFELGQGYFARGIACRLKEIGAANSNQRELEALSHSLAGNLLSLLRWWLDHGAKESAQAIDELYHRTVWKGLLQDSSPRNHSN